MENAGVDRCYRKMSHKEMRLHLLNCGPHHALGFQERSPARGPASSARAARALRCWLHSAFSVETIWCFICISLITGEPEQLFMYLLTLLLLG